MQPQFFEIVKDVLTLPSLKARAIRLRKYVESDKRIAVALRFAYDPEIVWRLPSGFPNFASKNHPAGLTMIDLLQVTSDFWLYTNLAKKKLPNLIPESELQRRFLNLLQELYLEDAKLLCAIKDKNIPGITPEIALYAIGGTQELPSDGIPETVAASIANPTKSLEDLGTVTELRNVAGEHYGWTIIKHGMSAPKAPQSVSVPTPIAPQKTAEPDSFTVGQSFTVSNTADEFDKFIGATPEMPSVELPENSLLASLGKGVMPAAKSAFAEIDQIAATMPAKRSPGRPKKVA